MGFRQISGEPVHRLIMRSWGKEKSGKNHFGLTAPSPIYGMYFDPGSLEGVAEKFCEPPLGPKEIHEVQYRFNKKKNTQDEAKALKAEFKEDYETFLNSDAKTGQIDETELWELFRFAEFGRESSKGQFYGPLNGEYRGLLHDAYDAKKNLQLIQKVKAVWEDDKPTDKIRAVGFPEAGNVVQVNLEHSWTVDGGFKVTVYQCRQNMAIAGETFDDLDFATLGSLVFPDTSESDWTA